MFMVDCHSLNIRAISQFLISILTCSPCSKCVLLNNLFCTSVYFYMCFKHELGWGDGRKHLRVNLAPGLFLVLYPIAAGRAVSGLCIATQ